MSSKNNLYYFAGGGFRGAPTKEHWLLCAELCRSLPDYQVHLISYPLAPNNPASESIPHLEKLYRTLAKQSVEQRSRITLMGDSAGGNIALVLGLYAASEHLREGGTRVCPVRSVFVISPAVDYRNENPAIDEMDPHDPILSRKTIQEVSDTWKGAWSVEDPRVSPTLADISVLQQANIKVDGVLGMYDVLAPDAVLFRDKLAEVGVVGQWLDWDKQMHCFPILFSHHVKEAVEAKDWVVNVLKVNSQSKES
jgi:acetyl esterase/lipase